MLTFGWKAVETKVSRCQLAGSFAPLLLNCARPANRQSFSNSYTQSRLSEWLGSMRSGMIERPGLVIEHAAAADGQAGEALLEVALETRH